MLTKLAETLSTGNDTRVYYFSTPPAIYGDICDGLNHANLLQIMIVL